jgi:hypothetical protein
MRRPWALLLIWLTAGAVSRPVHHTACRMNRESADAPEQRQPNPAHHSHQGHAPDSTPGHAQHSGQSQTPDQSPCDCGGPDCCPSAIMAPSFPAASPAVAALPPTVVPVPAGAVILPDPVRGPAAARAPPA